MEQEYETRTGEDFSMVDDPGTDDTIKETMEDTQELHTEETETEVETESEEASAEEDDLESDPEESEIESLPDDVEGFAGYDIPVTVQTVSDYDLELFHTQLDEIASSVVVLEEDMLQLNDEVVGVDDKFSLLITLLVVSVVWTLCKVMYRFLGMAFQL